VWVHLQPSLSHSWHGRA